MPATAPRPPKAQPTDSPYAPRLARLAGGLADHGASHLLVTNPIDVGYLTGFLGGESYLLVPANPGRPVVITDFRYEEELDPVKPFAEIHIRTTGMNEAVAAVFEARRVGACAFQAEHLTVAELAALGALVGAKKLVPTTGLVATMRQRKDEHEIRLMKQAIRLQEEALAALLPTIEVGQTELEIAGRLEMEMKARGSMMPGFPTIVAARANGSLPHYRPGKTKVAPNRPLLIDWGAVYQGYHGDMTRTFAIGKWPSKLREIFHIVRDAQQMAADALAPGRSTHEIDGIARDHIRRHGYGDQFGHGLGHGLGMIKEPPYLNPLYPDATLEPGHVVTVEPGIYIPGLGGVRIEDQYVITDRGAKNFCTLPKDIEWATL